MTTKDTRTKAEKEAAERQASADLEQIYQLGQLGEEYTVVVRRHPEGFLDSVPADVISEEYIKDRWGGGRYKLRPQKDGQYFAGGKQVDVRIAGPPVSDSQPKSELEQLRAKVDELVAATRVGGGAPQPDGTAVMLQMMTTFMSPILTAVLDRKPENSAVEIFELAQRFATQMGGGGHDADPYGSVLRELGVPLVQELRQLRENGEGRAALPAPPPPPPDVGPKGPPQSAQELAQRIADWLEPLEKAGRDPELRAYVWLEEMEGSALLEPALELLFLPNAVEMWGQVAPAVAANPEWYGLFVAQLRELVQDDDDGESEPAGGRGDVGDAPDDAVASAAGKS